MLHSAILDLNVQFELVKCECIQSCWSLGVTRDLTLSSVASCQTIASESRIYGMPLPVALMHVGVAKQLQIIQRTGLNTRVWFVSENA